MYKLLKERGNNSNIVLKNTETKAEVIIGRLSSGLMTVLEGQGYTFDASEERALKLKDEWNIELNEETGKAIGSMAMLMKKPIRDQRKKPVEKKSNKEIDAMDVLLGLATYN